MASFWPDKPSLQLFTSSWNMLFYASVSLYLSIANASQQCCFLAQLHFGQVLAVKNLPSRRIQTCLAHLDERSPPPWVWCQCEAPGPRESCPQLRLCSRWFSPETWISLTIKPSAFHHLSRIKVVKFCGCPILRKTTTPTRTGWCCFFEMGHGWRRLPMRIARESELRSQASQVKNAKWMWNPRGDTPWKIGWSQAGVFSNRTIRDTIVPQETNQIKLGSWHR